MLIYHQKKQQQKTAILIITTSSPPSLITTTVSPSSPIAPPPHGEKGAPIPCIISVAHQAGRAATGQETRRCNAAVKNIITVLVILTECHGRRCTGGGEGRGMAG